MISIFNMLIEKRTMSRDASFHQTTDQALSNGGRYQVYNWNRTAVTLKRQVIFIFVKREGISFHGASVADSNF